MTLEEEVSLNYLGMWHQVVFTMYMYLDLGKLWYCICDSPVYYNWGEPE